MSSSIVGWTVPNEEQFRFHIDKDVRLARDPRALRALRRWARPTLEK